MWQVPPQAFDRVLAAPWPVWWLAAAGLVVFTRPDQLVAGWLLVWLAPAAGFKS